MNMSLSPSTQIDRSELLKLRMQEDAAELATLQTAAAMQVRDRAREQTVAGLEAAAKAADSNVASFESLIANQIETLRSAVADRFTNWRGRYHVPDASVHVNNAAAQLVTLLNGKLEAEQTAKQAHQRYDDATRVPVLDAAR
jgi:hypothetical protein